MNEVALVSMCREYQCISIPQRAHRGICISRRVRNPPASPRPRPIHTAHIALITLQCFKLGTRFICEFKDFTSNEPDYKNS